MVLGILSLVMAQIILGPIAWYLGTQDMKKIRAGTMDPEGESQTNIGRICGMIGTGIGVVGCCIGIAWLGVVLAFVPFAIEQEKRERERQRGPEFKFEMKDFPKEMDDFNRRP
jgi:hypothetical protein